MSIVDETIQAYQDRYGIRPAAAAAAPGRVEIMGNHTDYNGGFVLPAALDKVTVVAGETLLAGKIVLYAADFGLEAHSSTTTFAKDPAHPWADYVLGVAQQLQLDGVKIDGFRAVLHSNVPTGAGLSSSAALEVATALFLRQLYPFERTPMQIARLCQRAENVFVGVQCGILDQFSSVFGKQDSLLFLDCLTLEHDSVKMGREDIAIVVCDSAVEHTLTGGDYNTRRAECMAAAAHFGKSLLREVSWDEFTAREGELPENQRKRARHILCEDRRVLAMRTAVAAGDEVQMGQLLAEGHASCRDLFENSTPEIDFLVEAATQIDGCIGAKMTGGGWGGCTVNLVWQDAVDDFRRELTSRYQAQTGHTARIFVCHAAQGAHSLEI